MKLPIWLKTGSSIRADIGLHGSGWHFRRLETLGPAESAEPGEIVQSQDTTSPGS